MSNILILGEKEGNHHRALFDMDPYYCMLFSEVRGHTLCIRAIIIFLSKRLHLRPCIRLQQPCSRALRWKACSSWIL